jgi:ABC-type glycerol-3-phosphate transport system substrate-binding protein
MKRLTVVLILLAVMLTPVFGAAQQEESAEPVKTSERGQPFVLGSEPLEMSWWRGYDWSSGQDWPREDRYGDVWIHENLDVSIEFPGADGAWLQKLNFMIIEDEFYDVLQIDRGPEVERLVQNGKLVAVDPWLDKYTNLRDGLGEDLINLLRSSDGKLYQVPNWAIGPDRLNGNAGWFLNSEIYEDMGRPELKTFDQMYEYLAAVKERHPNVTPLETGENNQAFTWVVSGFDNYLGSSFLQTWYAAPEDGGMVSIFDHDAFVEGALWYSRAFRNGLITQDAFTQTRDQVREKLNNQQVAVMVSNDAAGEADRSRAIIRQEDPGAEPWIFIDPILSASNPASLDEFKWMPRNRLGWNVNIITKDAGDKAEKIFALMDWMFGPYGSMVLRLGPPNELWDADGWDPDTEQYPDLTPEFFETSADERARYGGSNWVGNTSFADGFGEYLNSQIDDPSMKSWKQLQFTNTIWPYAFDATEFSNIEPAPDSDEGIIYQEVTDIMDETYAQIAFAGSDSEVREIIEDAREAVFAAGFAQVLAHYNEVWNENKIKMAGGN